MPREMSREELAQKWMDAQADFGRAIRELQALYGLNPESVPEGLRAMTEAARKLEAARKEYREAMIEIGAMLPDAQTHDAREEALAKFASTPIKLPDAQTTPTPVEDVKETDDTRDADNADSANLDAFAKRLREIQKETERAARLEKAVRSVILRIMEKMEDAARRGANYYFTIWDHRFEDSCRTLTESDLFKVEDKIVARFISHAAFDTHTTASRRDGRLVTMHAIQLRE